jgi:formamidopyrimidine-DNA glycosylase
MPELPEVETVRRGLAPVMEGAVFARVEARRPDLRFPLPTGFARRLTGGRVVALRRRGKYLIGEISTGDSLIMHLGMSGRFTIDNAGRPGDFRYAAPGDPRHDHICFEMTGAQGRSRVTYNDPRRFGFMDLIPTEALASSIYFARMGPEPLGAEFTDAHFNASLKSRAAPIKAVLLDQSVVAGVGNIYACEALFAAGLAPRRMARSVAGARAARLRKALAEVLDAAILAGGSSLRDFAASDGALGYFQHRFRVYGREGEPCSACGGAIRRIAQAGRSTFYCGRCQR